MLGGLLLAFVASRGGAFAPEGRAVLGQHSCGDGVAEAVGAKLLQSSSVRTRAEVDGDPPDPGFQWDSFDSVHSEVDRLLSEEGEREPVQRQRPAPELGGTRLFDLAGHRDEGGWLEGEVEPVLPQRAAPELGVARLSDLTAQLGVPVSQLGVPVSQLGVPVSQLGQPWSAPAADAGASTVGSELPLAPAADLGASGGRHEPDHGAPDGVRMLGRSAATLVDSEVVHGQGINQTYGAASPEAAHVAPGRDNALRTWWGETPNGATNNSSSVSGATAADLSGVKADDEEDVWVFVTQLLINSGLVFFCFTLFGVLRLAVPQVYQAGPGDATRVPRGEFGWILHSYRLPVDDIAEVAGLDRAQLVDFARMAERIMAFTGGPILGILMPAHAFAGDGAAGRDALSRVGAANLGKGSWVFWLHSLMTWYVVVITAALVRGRMQQFMPRRLKWLKEMPHPRSTSVLVEGIPEGMNNQRAITNFFNRSVFAGTEAVTEVHVIKDLGHSGLRSMIGQLEETQRSMSYRRQTPAQQRSGPECLMGLHSKKRQLEEAIHKQQDFMTNGDEVNSRACFVTFGRRRDATLVRRLLDQGHGEGMTASLPPDPSDVIWENLLEDSNSRSVRTILAYALLVMLLFAFMPITAFIASISKTSYLAAYVDYISEFRESHTHWATAWDGMIGSLALQIMMAFLPTLMSLIAFYLLRVRASAELQLRIHGWYFFFLVFFVVLVTTLGSSLLETFEEVIDRPTDVLLMLADNLPKCTHFYLNYMTLQWVTQSFIMIRLTVLLKFNAYRLFHSDDHARSIAEPEDQDFHGIGSRSARFTLTLLVAIVFCTLCPLILPLTLVTFCICRISYGYLFVYSETKKPDLGGEFFVAQLHHLHNGLYVYVLLMYSVLLGRARSWMPCWICLSSAAFNAIAHYRLRADFPWEFLPFEQLDDDQVNHHRVASQSSYRQPELTPRRQAPKEPEGFLQRPFGAHEMTSPADAGGARFAGALGRGPAAAWRASC